MTNTRPAGRIEHANITVSDPDRSAELLKGLLGWEERWRGPSMLGGETIHVGLPGDGEDYVALYTNDEVRGAERRYSKGAPLNHVGFTVDDLDAAEQVVLAAGLEPFSHSSYAAGHASFYFFDWDGIEFEIASYAGEAK